MRDLTEYERELRERRRLHFAAFFDERVAVLEDFVKRLGVADSPLEPIEIEQYLPAIDAFMKSQVVPSEDRVWILTRLGYFIGELLVQRFAGSWFLNEIPDSQYFLRYVVGR